MKNKLFSIQENGLYYKLKFLGISLNIRSLKLAYKEIKRLKQKMITSRSAEFFFASEDKFTTREKIWYLSQEFYEVVGYYPNFKYPKTFNEKLNWLKLNYYNPIHNVCIDKYRVKQYLIDKVGSEFVIPLIGVYDDLNDINFDSLPNQFVIKSNISGGALAVQVVKNKAKVNIDEVKAFFNDKLQVWNSLYYSYLSRGYKEIEPKIIIEKYIETSKGELCDYKIYCFNGVPKWILVCSGRNKKIAYENHYINWDLFIPSIKSTKKAIFDCPKNLEEMLRIAKKLSNPFPFLRVDLYEADGRIYVGELSFTPASGFNRYSKEWDYKIGEWLDLSKIPPEHLKILPEFAEGAKTFLAQDIVEKCIVRNEN